MVPSQLEKIKFTIVHHKTHHVNSKWLEIQRQNRNTKKDLEEEMS